MNFDHVASIYDTLACLVFGKSISRAKRCHLPMIKPDSYVLIIGGGTGWILEQLHPEIQSVTYIEPSKKMIAFAEKRKFNYQVDFINKPIENVHLSYNYDTIITNFFFDLYDSNGVDKLIDRLLPILETEGNWIVTDFVDKGKIWHKMLLSLMYSFFRITAGVKTSQLTEWREIMMKKGLRVASKSDFYGDFITSICYRKDDLRLSHLSPSLTDSGAN